jgi:hypothetical protein
MNILRSYLNCCVIGNLKTRRRSNNLKKPSAPLSLMKTYRMSLISTGSISLDSTFTMEKWCQVRICFLLTIFLKKISNLYF